MKAWQAFDHEICNIVRQEPARNREWGLDEANALESHERQLLIHIQDREEFVRARCPFG